MKFAAASDFMNPATASRIDGFGIAENDDPLLAEIEREANRADHRADDHGEKRGASARLLPKYSHQEHGGYRR